MNSVDECISKHRRLPLLKDWTLFIGPGVCLFMDQFSFIVGLKISNGILASSWQPSQGILAVIYGCCLGTERTFDLKKISGILLGTTGAILMITLDHHQYGDDENSDVWHTLGGSIMFFLNCSASVFYLILSRPAQRKYPSATITGYSYMTASFLMLFAALIVSSSNEILSFLCSDCDGAWTLPMVTVYALIYWVLIQSIVSYLLITWANRYADPSINCAYAVLQPLTATAASRMLLVFDVVPNCEHLPADSTKSCLYGPGIGDLGAVLICIGLLMVIASDRAKRYLREQSQHLIEEYSIRHGTETEHRLKVPRVTGAAVEGDHHRLTDDPSPQSW